MASLREQREERQTCSRPSFPAFAGRSPVLALAGRTQAQQAAGAVKPGCFVAPSIVRRPRCPRLIAALLSRARASICHTTPQYAAGAITYHVGVHARLSAVHRMTRST